MLLNRYVAGDGRRRAVAVSVKAGSSAGVVWGTDGLVVVAGWVELESLLETDGSLPVPVVAMANAQISFAV